LQEYSLNDTANALGISLAAAKGRLFHARGMLRRAIRMKEGNEQKQNEQLAARNRQLGRG
jgi:DNA-directed RNA polymerase specialized sigma24 family protein